MARLNDADWLKIKVKFESTNSEDISLEAIANEFGCSKGAISQKAKKDGWTRSRTKQTKQDNVNALNNLIEVTKQTKQELNEVEQELFTNEILAASKLKFEASTAQSRLLKLIDKAAQQVDNILDNNPSGLHIKSQGENGNSFGRNTEFVKDLIPAMNAANAILGIGKEQPTTAIQINNENKIEDKVIINIEGI